MTKIKLYKRIKYAGDVHKKLLELGWDSETAAAFLDDIPDVPITEYAPVVHGRWLPNNLRDPAFFICDQCGAMVLSEIFCCPSCWARMEVEGAEQREQHTNGKPDPAWNGIE